MINIVFCGSEGPLRHIEDELNSKPAVHLIGYYETLLLLSWFLDNLKKKDRESIMIKLLFRYKGETHLINVKDVCYIGITKRIVEMHVTGTQKGVYKTYSQLSDLEHLLGKLGFVRVNRYSMVSLDMIVRIRKSELLLTNGMSVRIGAPYKETVLSILNSKPNIKIN